MPFPIPLHVSILEVAKKTGGKILESNLLEELKGRGVETSAIELNAALIKLELHDKIRVTRLDKARRLIEATKP